MDAKGDIIMCKLKGWMDKGGNYDVEMKGWMQKAGNIRCKLKGGWIKECIMKKYKGGWKRWHYDVQIKRVDG